MATKTKKTYKGGFIATSISSGLLLITSIILGFLLYQTAKSYRKQYDQNQSLVIENTRLTNALEYKELVEKSPEYKQYSTEQKINYKQNLKKIYEKETKDITSVEDDSIAATIDVFSEYLTPYMEADTTR